MKETISKKQIAIYVICFAIGGFILSEMYKSSFQIVDKEYGSIGIYEEQISLKSGIKYVVSVNGMDEEMGIQQWADLEFNVVIINKDKEEICNRNIVGTTTQETGGIRRVNNSCETYYTASYADYIDVFIDFKEGAEVELKVYEDISDLGNLAPSLFIILLFIAIVYYIKIRAKYA